jgi:hypothetical protein
MAIQPNIDMEYVERMATSSRPIPGQSLTNNPDEPLPFEKPTKFVEVQTALDYLFLELTEEGTAENLKKILEQQMPVSIITEQLLFKGFSEGLWNPDLMLLLLEPTMYMVISVADRLGVENVIIEEGDEPLEVELKDEEKVRRLQEATKVVIKGQKEKSQMNGVMNTPPTETIEPPLEPTSVEPMTKSLLSKEEG